MARLRQADADKRAERDLSQDFSEALARGLNILTAFDDHRRQMTLSDLARAVDLPRATVRRAVYTLEKLGYVDSDGRLFRLTPQVLKLAAAYLGANAATAILQPACERICAAVDESCTAAVLDGEDVTMIARALPAQLMPVGLGIGYRIPAFCSALGRVLLAALPEDRLAAWLDALVPVAQTPATLLDKGLIRAAIRQAGADGFGYVDQEAEFGFRSIAVPIRRHDGKVIAALNIGTRVERHAPDILLGQFLPILQREALALAPQMI